MLGRTNTPFNRRHSTVARLIVGGKGLINPGRSARWLKPLGVQGAEEPRLVNVFQKSSSLKLGSEGFSGNRRLVQMHDGDDLSLFIDGDDFDIEVDVCRLLLNNEYLANKTRAGDLLLSNSSIDYALNAFSATILAWGSSGRVAAHLSNLTSLACLLGSAGEKHGWLSCVGHFGWIIQLLLTEAKCQGDSIQK